MYDQIPDEEKIYEKVALAYEKLEDMKRTLERAIQKLLGIYSYVNRDYNQVESVVQHDFSQKVVAKGTTIDGDTEGIYVFYMQLPEGYFWFGSNVDDFDNLTFEISESGNPSVDGTFVGRGIGDHNGA